MSNPVFVFILYTSEGCSHCMSFLKIWTPISQEIRKQYQNVKLLHVHIDSNKKEVLKINDVGLIPQGIRSIIDGVPAMFIIRKDLWDQYLNNKKPFSQGVLSFGKKLDFDINGVQVRDDEYVRRTDRDILDFIGKASQLLMTQSYIPKETINSTIVNNQIKSVDSHKIKKCNISNVGRRYYNY